MDLSSRLDALVGKKLAKAKLFEAIEAGALEGVGVGERAITKQPELPVKARLVDLFPHAETVENEAGKFVLLTKRLNFHPVGTPKPEGQEYEVPLTWPSAETFAKGLLAVFPELETEAPDLCATEIAFIDTETTMLSFGAGSLAFLIGVGWFEESPEGPCFVLEQYFIDDFDQEPAMMKALVERLSGFRAFSSYNGKCFDLPLLRTRGIMNRIPPKTWRKPNLDLLHPARRLWRGSLENVRLFTVERDIFGLCREDDVPGAEIPQIWLDYARTGRPGRLKSVIHHNAQDIASLGAALVYLGRCYSRPEALACPEELEGLSRWFEKQKDFPTARRLLERAIELTRESAKERALMWRLVGILKRMREWDDALQLWRTLSDSRMPEALEAWVEMAKVHEHHRKNPEAALKVMIALEDRLLWEEDFARVTGRGAAILSPEAREEIIRRVVRLKRKTARNNV